MAEQSNGDLWGGGEGGRGGGGGGGGGGEKVGEMAEISNGRITWKRGEVFPEKKKESPVRSRNRPS